MIWVAVRGMLTLIKNKKWPFLVSTNTVYDTQQEKTIQHDWKTRGVSHASVPVNCVSRISILSRLRLSNLEVKYTDWDYNIPIVEANIYSLVLFWQRKIYEKITNSVLYSRSCVENLHYRLRRRIKLSRETPTNTHHPVHWLLETLAWLDVSRLSAGNNARMKNMIDIQH